MRNRHFRDRAGSMRFVALLAVLAFALGACSGSTTKWPTAGDARSALSSQYSYNFVHYNDTWRAANGMRTMQISITDQDAATDQMSVSVFLTSYEPFAKDIDNVFAVIAPDARSWAHDELKRTQSSEKLNDQFQASGGLVTLMWDKSVPMLTFVFTGAGASAS